jgi:hypothetical protein
MSLLAGESFTNFWFQFESVLKVSQKVSNKNRKIKRERKGKRRKGPGTDSSPQPKTAHGPFPSPPRISTKLSLPRPLIGQAHLSSLPRDLNKHGAVPGAITANFSAIWIDLLPLVHANTPI